ncbi:MAG: malectin [Mycobacteriales bacterium]
MLLKKATFLALPLTLVPAGVLHFARASAASSAPWSIRINAGGPAFTDTSGRHWEADEYFQGGTAATNANSISSAADPTPYRSERYGLTGYRIPVPHPGIYTLTLSFAENWATAPGQRVFTVSAEGQPVVPDLDLVSAIGASTAYDSTVTVRTDDAFVDLGFSAAANNALVNGIEVRAVNAAAAGAPATPAPAPADTTLTSTHRPATPVAGATAICTGRLTRTQDGAPVPGAPVDVSLRPDVGPSRTVRVTTNSNGGWGLLCTSVYSTVVSARYAGDAQNGPAGATPYKMAVATRLTVTSPRSGVVSGVARPLVVQGTTSPNKAGRVLVLERVLSGGRLQPLARAVVARTGTWRFSVPLRRGDYQLEVVIGGTVGNVGGTSAPFVVHRR